MAADSSFDLVSDFNKDAITAYDVSNPDMLGLKGISRRAVFVVDGDGTIRHREVTASPGDEPNYEAVHQALRRIG